MQNEQVVKGVVDVAAYSTVGATLLGWLPAISSIFAILWFSLQITEKVVGKPFHELVKCVWQWVKGLRR